MTDEEKAREERSAVETILGSPVFIGPDERTDKVRGHLIFVAAISIFVVVAGLHFGSESSLAGLQITGLTDHKVYWALLLFVIYQLFHYLWCAWDVFLEWRLRITGMRGSRVAPGQFDIPDGDHAQDPRQSTLYNWWLKHAKQIGSLRESVTEINNRLQRIESATNSSLDPNRLSAIRSELSSLQTQAQLMKQAFNACTETIASARIPVSLERFDDWFRLFWKSQNRRWLVFNVLAPILLSFAAVCLLAWKIFAS